MTIEPAASTELSLLQEFLTAHALPAEDLEARHLEEFLVCREGDQLVGCVALEPYPPDGLLRSLAVREDQRGRGLARRLVDQLVERARQRGFTTLYLLTTTAEALFLHLGWLPTDRAEVPDAVRQSSEFAALCPASAACLRLPLSPRSPGERDTRSPPR